MLFLNTWRHHYGKTYIYRETVSLDIWQSRHIYWITSRLLQSCRTEESNQFKSSSPSQIKTNEKHESVILWHKSSENSRLASWLPNHVRRWKTHVPIPTRTSTLIIWTMPLSKSLKLHFIQRNTERRAAMYVGSSLWWLLQYFQTLNQHCNIL